MEHSKFDFEDEIRFKEVFKHPSRWFGYTFIYFLIIIFAISLVFLNRIDSIQRNVVPFDEPDPAKAFKDVEFKEGQTVEGINIAEIKTPTDELIKRGAELYKTTCVSCHGEEGKGNGIASTGLNPAPRDFTSSNGWKNGRTIVQMYKTLEEGIPGSAMVPYDYIPPKDKISLIYYIRKFAKDFPEPTDNDFTELDATYKITQQREVPAQIPISLSIAKIDEENLAVSTQADSLSKVFSGKFTASDFSKIVNNYKSLAVFLTKVKSKVANPNVLGDLIVANIPNNGISPTFVLENTEIKQRFIKELLFYLNQ